jgi:hypothetical protein
MNEVIAHKEEAEHRADELATQLEQEQRLRARRTPGSPRPSRSSSG